MFVTMNHTIFACQLTTQVVYIYLFLLSSATAFQRVVCMKIGFPSMSSADTIIIGISLISFSVRRHNYPFIYFFVDFYFLKYLMEFLKGMSYSNPCIRTCLIWPLGMLWFSILLIYASTILVVLFDPGNMAK